MLLKYYRLFAILAWSTCMGFLCAAGAAFDRLFSRCPRRSSWERFYRAWAAGAVRIAGMKIEVRGEIPAPPFFIVTNHLTFADIFLLVSQLGCIFVAKNEIADWPVFGPLARVGKSIFINRKSLRDTVRVNREIQEAMNKGLSLALFAESGVSTDGALRTFKAALLEPCARANFPVHYASIHYESPEGSPPASEVIVWRKGIGLFQHFFGIASLPSFKAVLTLGDAPIASNDRKILAASLYQAVEKQLIRTM